MTARTFLATLVVALGSLAPLRAVEPGALTVYRTDHFKVEAADEATARTVAERADEHRRALAMAWLGHELPAWDRRCTVRVSVALGPPGGVTHFTYGPGTDGRSTVTGIAIEVAGPLDIILRGVLPHEIAHAVLTTHFGRPVPRWADEGLAILGEPDDIQAATDMRLRELQAAGRTMQVKTLLGLKEYPADRYTVYAQGHSVARYLLTCRANSKLDTAARPAASPGRRKLLRFVETGMAKGWDEASRQVYGFPSLEALEESWTEWLQTDGSRYGKFGK